MNLGFTGRRSHIQMEKKMKALHIKTIRECLRFLSFLGCLLIISSCSTTVYVEPEEGLLKDGPSDYLGYSVQVGAFSGFENAIRYKNRLMPYTDAFCFRDQDKLYKIRFGNFRSRGEAISHASDLKNKNIISDYFMITPDRYHRPDQSGSDIRDELVGHAKKYLGVPYRWGWEDVSTGFDCSGLTLSVYRESGINLPRTARSQYSKGRYVSKRDLKEGDLVFFKTGKGSSITHVGVYIGRNTFIHAPGKGKKVRTESLSASYYKKRYGGGRTYLR